LQSLFSLLLVIFFVLTVVCLDNKGAGIVLLQPVILLNFCSLLCCCFVIYAADVAVVGIIYLLGELKSVISPKLPARNGQLYSLRFFLDRKQSRFQVLGDSVTRP
jgi:hypothetical protein